MKFQEESIAYLYFLLENNRFNQIIKGMINQTVSKKLLTQCGYTYEKYSGLENFKLNTSVARFSIRQLVYLKGSSFQRVKQYQNKPLLDIVHKKLKTQLPTSECRKTLWVQFSQLYQKPHFYNNLKQFQLPIQFEKIIKKDINRTYKSPQVKVKASQVLGLFAIYNPFIGYCQGMNSIIAFLIDDGFTGEQAFFIFKYITENLLPCDYYNNMDCIMAYMRIFYQLLSFTHPQIYTKLKHIAKQMDNSYMAMVSFVLQWFVCLFCTDNVNIQITKVIWDFFLIQGVITLFKASIAIFDLLQHHILKCKTFCTFAITQNNTTKCKKHIQNKQLIQNTFDRRQQIFTYLQQYCSSQNKNQQKQKIINVQKKKSPKFHKIKCNKKWNSCAQVINNNFDNNVIYDYFVFKAKGEINIMDNYLEKMDKIYFNNQRLGNMMDELKIGRIQHVCHPQQDVLTQDSISERSGETNLQIRKKYAESLSHPKSPIKMSQSTLRRKAARKIQEAMKKKPSMQRSQSLIFMQKMAQNVSLSNLLQLYQVDEMFQQ